MGGSPVRRRGGGAGDARPLLGAGMTRKTGQAAAMMRARRGKAAGAGLRAMRRGAAEAATPPRGTIRRDPAAAWPPTPGADSAGPRPHSPQLRSRTRGWNHVGDPQAVNQATDVVPDVFAMRVLLEDSGEMFRVTNCRSNMTVRELKEELDLTAGIPFNLQRLQYLDQGGPCPTPFLATCTPLHPAAKSPLNLQWGKGSPPRPGPPDGSKQIPHHETPGGKANPGHLGTSQFQKSWVPVRPQISRQTLSTARP